MFNNGMFLAVCHLKKKKTIYPVSHSIIKRHFMSEFNENNINVHTFMYIKYNRQQVSLILIGWCIGFAIIFVLTTNVQIHKYILAECDSIMSQTAKRQRLFAWKNSDICNK